MPWSAKFDEPIELPDGKKLLTLKDTVDYLGKTVPKAEHQDRKVLIPMLQTSSDREEILLRNHVQNFSISRAGLQ